MTIKADTKVKDKKVKWKKAKRHVYIKVSLFVNIAIKYKIFIKIWNKQTNSLKKKKKMDTSKHHAKETW